MITIQRKQSTNKSESFYTYVLLVLNIHTTRKLLIITNDK